MKTELELLREATEDAKTVLNKLTLQLLELESKKKQEKWSPKGGDWYLDESGGIKEAPSLDWCKNFGNERDTEAECQDLRKKQEWLNFTHAYACENDGAQEFVYNAYNWSIGKISSSIIAQSSSLIYDCEKVYMTEKDAKEFVQLCAEDLINFQFQGGL